jgi:predicted DNA-binding transcriptional regulator YafY
MIRGEAAVPRSERQRLKILYIADYLMRETDGELDEKGLPLHGVLISEIKDYLESVGIDAEKHSIRRDIDLLNGLYRDSDGNELYFDPLMDIRGGKGKPIYLGTRYLPFDDLETIVECVASANFISRPEAEELIEALKKLCSENQAKRLTREYIVAERPKYTEKRMMKYLRIIKASIKNNQKISFFYTRHSPKDITKTENRNKGKRYIVSPFNVVLSNGNHYLIGYDDTYHQIKPYRIDRMKDVKPLDEPTDGKDKYDRMGISDYAKQTFGMFIGGNADRITIQFENSLLDAMLERFPEGSATVYTKIDDKHFTVRTFIVESENFYGWVCGLGEKAIITDPPETVERFKSYLQKISEKYK